MERNMTTILELASRFEIKVREISDSQAKVSECPVYEPGNKRGCVLIMSNPFIGNGVNYRREASEKDVKMMRELWKDEIGCELFDIGEIDANTHQQSQKATDHTRIDLRTRIKNKNPNKTYEKVTAEEMKELLMSLSETKEDYAYIVVAISTHGAVVTEKWLQKMEDRDATVKLDSLSAAAKNAEGFRKYKDERRSTARPSGEDPFLCGVFFGEDWMPVSEYDMMKLFRNDRSEAYKLKGIPNFFIFDYCRGDGGADKNPETKGTTKGGNDGGPDVELNVAFPIMSDTVIAYATHRFYNAFDDSNGSWLTGTISKVFKEHYEFTDVLDMLTKVNKEVQKKSVNTKAMSIFESSLLKKFYLSQRSDIVEQNAQSPAH